MTGTYQLELIFDTDSIFVCIATLDIVQLAALVCISNQFKKERGDNLYPALRVGIILAATPTMFPRDAYLICQDIGDEGEMYETIMFRKSLENRGLM